MCDCIHCCLFIPPCEDDPGHDEDDFDEDYWYEKDQEEKAMCHCGAHQWSMKAGEYVQVADCICPNMLLGY